MEKTIDQSTPIINNYCRILHKLWQKNYKYEYDFKYGDYLIVPLYTHHYKKKSKING